jgi:hypothetical protein
MQSKPHAGVRGGEYYVLVAHTMHSVAIRLLTLLRDSNKLCNDWLPDGTQLWTSVWTGLPDGTQLWTSEWMGLVNRNATCTMPWA